MLLGICHDHLTFNIRVKLGGPEHSVHFSSQRGEFEDIGDFEAVLRTQLRLGGKEATQHSVLKHFFLILFELLVNIFKVNRVDVLKVLLHRVQYCIIFVDHILIDMLS